MTYSWDDIIAHVEGNACVVMEGGDFPEGTFYQNLVNFEICYIPKESELDEITCCDIFYELGIPAMDGLEHPLEVFEKFRKDLAKVRSNQSGE
jgi:hypothetical protein